jgi:phage terminase Nu1 subunit (DNA packaging protein)
VTVTAARAAGSIAALAKRLGVDRTTVYNGIQLGRLTKAVVGRNARGKLYILDLEAAVAEWGAQAARLRLDAKRMNGSASPSDLARATVRERLARAELLELRNAQQLGHLVPARDVEQQWATAVVATRTALLGLPSRARGRLPHLTAADVAVLDGLIRETLTELAEAMG